MLNCKYLEEMKKQDININDMNYIIKCMTCDKEVRFGVSYLIYCSSKCAFYHKYVCEKCAEKYWEENK